MEETIAAWAYTATIVAVVIGATVVFFLFPRKNEEERLLIQYHEEDANVAGPSSTNQVPPL